MTDKFTQDFNEYNKLMRRLGSKQMTLLEYKKYRAGKMRPKRNGAPKSTLHSEGYRRPSPVIPSGDGIAYTPSNTDRKEYTGTFVKGISTLHKSNSVPVTNNEDILAIARMRR